MTTPAEKRPKPAAICVKIVGPDTTDRCVFCGRERNAPAGGPVVCVEGTHNFVCAGCASRIDLRLVRAAEGATAYALLGLILDGGVSITHTVSRDSTTGEEIHELIARDESGQTWQTRDNVFWEAANSLCQQLLAAVKAEAARRRAV